MITRELLEKGYDLGAVRLISSPHGDGTVCQIGEYWLYFGGQTAEEMEPEEYRRNVPKANILDEILIALEGIRDDLSEDEYNYERTARKPQPVVRRVGMNCEAPGFTPGAFCFVQF